MRRRGPMAINPTLHSAIFAVLMSTVYVGTSYQLRKIAEETKERQRQMQIRAAASQDNKT
jgi:hypothetical protein